MSLTALIFVAAFLAGCMLALIRHPIFGLLTYVGVFYIHPPSRWWGQGLLLDIRWAYLAAVVTVAAMIIRPPKQPTALVFRDSAFLGFIALIIWIAIQWFWALDRELHVDLLTYYLKFAVVIVMIVRCIETEQHLRLFLWTHVSGCFYLGWLAFTSYSGGRLDGVGGPGINEANAAALQMVTGIMVAGSLFLAGSARVRAVLLAMLPIMVNGLVTTISRSGFLSAAVAGLAYNVLTPAKYKKRVAVLSILAGILFLLLTNDIYWDRIATIKFKGAEVEGIDTGGGRPEIIKAQVRMFEAHPFGCGHMCTTILSSSYLDARYLQEGLARASHNTFMTMLVDHGVPGGITYVLLLLWTYRTVRATARNLGGEEGFLPAALPAVGATLAAIFIADQFVQYPKFEARFWFIALLISLSHMSAVKAEQRAKRVALKTRDA